jgi:hypothetical protein
MSEQKEVSEWKTSRSKNQDNKVKSASNGQSGTLLYLFQCRQTSIQDAPLGLLSLLVVLAVVVVSREGKKE